MGIREATTHHNVLNNVSARSSIYRLMLVYLILVCLQLFPRYILAGQKRTHCLSACLESYLSTFQLDEHEIDT